MAAKKIKVWEDFTAGPYGSRDPADPRHNYTGYNCQLYRNGSLGPRPGWRGPWTLTGAQVAGSDQKWGFGHFTDFDDDDMIWIGYDDASAAGADTIDLFYYTAPDTTVTKDSSTVVTAGEIGHHGTTVSWLADWSSGGVYYYRYWKNADMACIGQKLYTVFPGTAVSTTEPIPGAWVCQLPHRDILYMWGDLTSEQTIYYTDEGDWTTYSGSSFDVGPVADERFGVVDLFSVQNTLLIVRRDGQWFSLSGGSPESGTLREIDKGPVPWNWSGCVLDGLVLFPLSDGTGIVVATPQRIDTATFSHIDFTRIPEYEIHFHGEFARFYRSVSDERTSQVSMVCSDTEMTNAATTILGADLINGVWNYTVYDQDDDIYSFFLQDFGRPNVLFAMHTGNSSTTVLSRYTTLDRPAKLESTGQDVYSVPLSDEEDADAANPAEMLIRLSDIRSDSAGLLKPEKLVLDIDYWKIGSVYNDPIVDVTVSVVGIDDDTPELSAAEVSFTTSGWDNSNAIHFNNDLPRRRRLEVPCEYLPFASAIRVELRGDGWALVKATMFYTELDATP